MRATALIVVLGLAPAAPAGATEKTVVSSLDDLPRHTYAVKGKASALLQSDEVFDAFAAQVRADLETDLAAYEIRDAATLQGIYTTLHRLDILQGDDEAALQWLERSEELEDKEALRLTGGLIARAFIAARSEVAAGAGSLEAAFERHLERAVAALPWDVAGDEIERTKGRTEILSENLILGLAQAEVDPAAERSGEIGAELARTLVALRHTLGVRLAVRDQIVSVLQRQIDAHRQHKEDIWAERAVALQPEQDLTPVVVAIWDSGVDTSVYEGQLWVNQNEKSDGSDSDGNGFVDDVHGIAFDVDGHRTPLLLHPVGDMDGKLEQVMRHSKGFMDLQASFDSPEASDLKRYLAGLEPGRVREFLEGLNFSSLYLHGTHVAGIAVDGNPFARILTARISFDYHAVPKLLTAEIARRHARSYRDTVDYFTAYGVRVVNMSWGWSLNEVQAILEANGAGANAEERARLTREIFGILREGLSDAIGSAPDILFITAAGNDDNDVEFDAVIPSSFDLPNLITVAAVDQAGDPTSFTSTGRNVVVYANGFEVESYVPGGDRMAASGTSMSSPAVMNLAAKLLALDPSLSTTEVVRLIKQGADSRDPQRQMLLIHPQRTVKLLQSRSEQAG